MRPSRRSPQIRAYPRGARDAIKAIRGKTKVSRGVAELLDGWTGSAVHFRLSTGDFGPITHVAVGGFDSGLSRLCNSAPEL